MIPSQAVSIVYSVKEGGGELGKTELYGQIIFSSEGVRGVHPVSSTEKKGGKEKESKNKKNQSSTIYKWQQMPILGRCCTEGYVRVCRNSIIHTKVPAHGNS